MHIIVVGAGEVGSYVADRLSREGHDVAVIEQHSGRLLSVEEQLDVLTVGGSGTHPQTLERAGVDKADLVVAVTSDDEVNMVTSLLAKQAGVERTVVRLEASELRGRDAEELREVIGADLVIDPDEETAQEIIELLEYPGATDVAVMGGGEVIVIGAGLSGLYAAMLAAEAARTAQALHNTKELSPAQMRDGMEALKIDAARMEELGLPGFGPEINVTCENHGGPGLGAIQQWNASDGTWTLINDFGPADRDVIDPLIMEDSMAYAKENNIPERCN